jgi:TP901 family phage tail tape measure protein
MADVNANIGVHIDTSAALAELKNLQRQLATFHSSVARNSAAATQAQKGLQTNLLNSINATGKFHAQMGLVRNSTESFTHALETNKLSMREYFRFAGGSTKTFGRLFKQEFNTIGKVAEERVKKMQTQYIKMGRDASGAIQSMSITPRTLDMTNYANKTAVAAQKQALLNQLLKQGSTNLLNFGKNTQWAGRQLMVGFTIPLAYFGTAAAKTFMDLEKQAIRFKRVYGDMFTTTEETNKALADVQQLAEEFTKYGVAVAQTMEMAANAAAMGKIGADLTAQVAQATRLAVLGGVEQSQALETTISVTNAFGVAAEDLANKINFLNAVENQTVVSIEDLTIAIPKAGPVVKQLGGEVEDLAFFLTAMKEGGINASEGANALKSGLASLINPSKKAAAMLNDLGININAIVEGNQGNVRQTVIDFSKALDTLDPLNRARAIEQLFGKFQFSRLSTLFQNVTKDGTQAARVLDLAGASIEELAILSERELGVLEDAIGTDFKESIENLKLAIAPIGKEFLKAITPVAKTIGEFLEKFNNLGDGTKKFIVIATTLVGVIGPVLLMTFGLLANGVANIIKLFITMRSGFLKAGSNTTLLAQQTQYLNTEQLEAATVAASLNQAHTRLTQSFNMEATAVRLLRQAYIDATIAATNFARANPGMMMPGFKPGMKGGKPKGFASGTTGLPGPRGAGDIIPILGAPGEAIIPAEISQDDRFKPLIAALVSGDIKGYETGTTGLKVPADLNPENKNYNASKRSANGIQQLLNEFVKNPNGTYNYVDPEGKYSRSNIPAAEISKAIDERYEQNKNRVGGNVFTAGQIKDKLGLTKTGSDARGRKSGDRSKSKEITKVIEKIRAQNIFDFEGKGEVDAIKKRLQEKGLFNERQFNKLIQVEASHIKPSIGPDGKKVWDLKNLVLDRGYVNNFLSNNLQGNLGKNLIQMSEEELKSKGIDKKVLSDFYRKEGIKGSETHPVTQTQAKTLQGIARYVISQDPKSLKKMGISNPQNALYQAHALDAGLDYRFKNNTYGTKGLKTLQDFQNIILTKREKVQFNDGKEKTVTGQTGTSKPPGMQVSGGAASDKRVIPAKNVSRVIPAKFGFKGSGSVAFGAAGGFDANGNPISTKPGMAISKVQEDFKAQQNSLRRQIEKVEQRRLVALKQELKIVEDKNKLAKQAEPLTKQQLKEQRRDVRAQRSQRIAGVAGPAAGALGMASMGAFMTGNTGMGMGLMGASAVASILPMLTNPITAVVAALTAAVAGVYFWNKSLEKSAKKQAEFVATTSATTQKMSEVGKITGAVGASEIMARRRESGSFGAYNDAQRAGSMFGDTFLQSDIGKTMVKGFVENMEKFGSKQAASDFALQLSTYVSDGVLTADQAAGIAEQIGIQLGNQRYTVQIQGDLRSIVGPNGENLAKDPLRVRTQIITQATKRTERELGKLAEAQASGTSGRNEAARIAAIAGNNLEIIKAQADATQVMYSEQISVFQKELERTTNLEKQLELKQKIANLESQQTKDVGNFNLAFSNQIDKELKTFAKLSSEQRGEGGLAAIRNTFTGGREDAYFDSLKSTVKDTYKGTAYESLATDALSRLAKLSDKSEIKKGGFKTREEAQTFEVQMSLLMKNKVINPEQSSALLDMFAGKLPELQNTLNLGIKTQGAEKTVAMLDFFMGLDLKKVNPATISAQIIKSDPATFDKIGEALAALQVLDGHEVNMSAYLDSDDAYERLVALANKLAIVEKMPTPITKESILKFYEEGGLVGTGVTKSQLELLMSKWQDFDALPDALQKEAISKFITIYETKFADEASKKEYMLQEAARMASASGFSDIGQDAEFRRLMSLMGTDPEKLSSEFVAAQTRSYIGDGKKEVTGKLGSSNVGSGGSRDTTLDDLLRKLKLTRDASINAQGGLKELQRVFKDSNGDITKFSGVIQQLNAAGADTGFIDFVSSLDNDTQKVYLNTELLKKGIVQLTKDGEIAMDLYKEAALGAFQKDADSQITNINAQVNGFKRLTAAGVGVADSIKLIADAEFMRSLSQAKTVKELDTLIKKNNELKQAQMDLLLATDPARAFQDRMEESLKYYDFLEKQARASVKLEIDRINNLIDANERLIQTQERYIEENINRVIEQFNQDLDLIDRSIAKINEKYDAQEKALQEISDINDDIAAKESSRISIADALTRGDISAAAKAIQEERQAAAQRAQEKSSKLLQIAREKEIAKVTSASGLTRAQIEEKIYALEQQRLPLVAAIVKLQDDNYTLQNDTLRKQEDSLKATLLGIDAARFAYEQQVIAIEAAQYKANGFNGILLVAEATLTRMKALWDSMNSKNAIQVANAAAVEAKTAEIAKQVSPELLQNIVSGANPNDVGEQARLDLAKEFKKTNSDPTGSLAASSGRYTAQAVAYYQQQLKGAAVAKAMGGIIPKYYVSGGYSKGTDTIPAMLTPGEFVVRRNAVDSFGVNNLNKINDGSYGGSSVYNYSLNVNVKSDSSPDDIARTVMTQIKRIDNQRIKTQRGA